MIDGTQNEIQTYIGWSKGPENSYILSTCICLFVNRFYYRGDRAQSFLAAAFLTAARTLLRTSLFLLEWVCVPILFLMNFRAFSSLETMSSNMGAADRK